MFQNKDNVIEYKTFDLQQTLTLGIMDKLEVINNIILRNVKAIRK